MKKIVLLLLALLVFVPVIALTSCGECEHSWTAASCAAPKTCTKCQATEGSALEHSFGDWNIINEATCNAEGSKARLCKNCGFLENGVIETNSNHTPVTVPAKDPTCVEPGATEGVKCSVCSEIITAPQPIEATGIHNWSKRWEKTPDGHCHPCIDCDDARSPIQPHIDDNQDSQCDICFYEGDGMATYSTVTVKTEYSGQLVDVATFTVENGTVMTADQLAELAALRYMGYGFKSFTYEDNTDFDNDAEISAPITIIALRGDLAGDKITWSYNETNKTLTLTGEGEMFDFANIQAVPWNGLAITALSLDTRITTIGDYSFYVGGAGNPGAGMRLTSTHLHEGITRIGKYAYYGELTIKELNLPNSLKVIDDHAFRECTALQNINIGNTNLERVGDSAFAQCIMATYVVFNDAIENSANVFEGCKFTRAFYAGNREQYETLEIGFGNEQLLASNSYMFFLQEKEPLVAGPFWHYDENNEPQQWCYAIYYKPYYLDAKKNSLPIAEDYIFVKNPTVTQENLDFRETIWHEGYQFSSWKGSIDFALDTTISGNTTFTGVRGNLIGDNATYSYETSAPNILKIEGSGKTWDFETVISTPWNVNTNFSKSKITEITISSDITYIGKYLFCDFPNLQYINIGTNIVEINTQAFSGCNNLKYVYYMGNELQASNVKGVIIEGETRKEVSDGFTKLDVPETTRVYYKELEGDNVNTLLISQGKEPAIRYWKTLGGINITWEFKDGVLTIGGLGAMPDVSDASTTPWAQTFYWLNKADAAKYETVDKAVTKVVVREGITEICDNMFAGLTSAADIELPSTVTKVSASAFNGTAFINDESKYDEAGLIVINDILIKVNTSISGNRILLPNSLTAIAEDAFSGCANVTEMRIPRGLSGVTAKSFDGLTGLTTIYFYAGEMDWNLSPCKDIVPQTAKVYFFSNTEPGCGYFWHDLPNPTLWSDRFPEVVHNDAECHTNIVFQEPTCAKPGKAYKDGCKYCGEVFDNTEVSVPATGEHTYEENSSGKWLCTVCGTECYHFIYGSDGNCTSCGKPKEE